MKFKVASSRCSQGVGKLTAMVPAVGTLAIVFMETLNGVETSPKHYTLLLFLPKGS